MIRESKWTNKAFNNSDVMEQDHGDSSRVKPYCQCRRTGNQCSSGRSGVT